MDWLNEVKDWIFNPKNHDQDANAKSNFLKSAKVGQTRLNAVGISNGELKKYVTSFNKINKDMDINEIINAANKIFEEEEILELQLLIVYLLEKRKKEFSEDLFKIIDSKWINKIDYWAISDHFCINLFGFFPLSNPKYSSIINSWKTSDNFWRRRLSISAYLRVAREDPKVLDHVLSNIQYLIQDENYYVRKAFPWLLRESTRKLPENRDRVFKFIKNNIEYLSKTELRDSMKYLSKEYQNELLSMYELSKI